MLFGLMIVRYLIYKLENRLYDMINDIVCTMFKSFIRFKIVCTLTIAYIKNVD